MPIVLYFMVYNFTPNAFIVEVLNRSVFFEGHKVDIVSFCICVGSSNCCTFDLV